MTDISVVTSASILAVQLITEIQQSLKYGMKKSDIQTLRAEIDFLKRYIEEADEKLEEHIPEKALMNQMRGVSELIEDLFDVNFMAAEAMKLRRLAGRLVNGAKLASETEKINALLLGIKERAEKKGSDKKRRCVREDREFLFLLNEWLPVGMGPTVKELTQKLLVGELDPLAVVIVGPAGIGKSGLAERVYKAVEEHFECCYWITVSHRRGISELLRLMMKQVYAAESGSKRAGIDLMSFSDDEFLSVIDEELISTPRQSLQSKIYAAESGNERAGIDVMSDGESDGFSDDEFESIIDEELISTPRQSFQSKIYAAESGNERARIDVMSDGESAGFSDDEFESISDEELVSTLRQSLRSKKYLVVLDDVCSKEVWDVMRDVLPDDNTGSRIIITTRNRRVAPNASFKSVQRMEPLSEAMSRDLLYGIAFFDEPEQRCPPELEQLSLEVVRMCEGFPFAIVAIASLLSTKAKVPREWQKLIENFSLEAELDDRLRDLYKILYSWFHDLPPPLKQCFLHFSVFPKGSLIPNDQLYKLWIAEGFVKEKAGQTLEEVAKEYLKELTNRNLVQACQEFYGVEEFSRVYSLMHEVGRKKASERSFCQIWDGKDSSFRGNSRRLLITHGTVEQVLESTEVESRIRTVFISNTVAPGNSALLALFQQCEILTLLVIENTPIEVIPEEVGNLLCLKYLSLKNTKVKTLPKSVGNLYKLQTLDLSGTLLIELPMEIFKLQSLRHLLASRCDNKISISSAKGVQIKGGIKYLVNLQTLMTVEAHLSGMVVIQQLKKLRKLRSLSVSRLTRELARALCACIKAMRELECLRLHSMSNEILDLQAITSPPPRLARLVLKGLLHKFPHWISGLRNLNMLCLSLSGLVDDPLQHLYFLPNLESLWLYRAYEGVSLRFPGGSFNKLKLLVLRDLQRLEMVEIEEGSLLLLEELRIGPSPLLNEVPSGINRLRNLNVVSFYDMPKEFILRWKPAEYWKLENVASVLFHYKDEGRRYTTYKLGETDLLNHLEGLDATINDVNERDIRLSFCYSDEEEDSDLTTTSRWNDIPHGLSFSSDRFTFFTDDVEE